MDNKLKFVIDEHNANIELREFLKNKMDFSSRFVRNAIRENRITLNKKKTFLSVVLKAGDLVTIVLNKEESQDIEPEFVPLTIEYEDSDIIIINKQPGIVVHPTRRYTGGTLANGLRYYFRESNQDCIVRLVNRLDMDTSGLVIVAKNQFAHSMLAKEMDANRLEKSYIAIVHGHLQSSGTIDLPIYRPGEGAIDRIVDERGQKSITHYEVKSSFEMGDVVELKLETGRTHQIRVHLSHSGFPIFGDTLYCKVDDSKLISRQALHAYKLAFKHPTRNEIINIETELPEDMKLLLEELTKDWKQDWSIIQSCLFIFYIYFYIFPWWLFSFFFYFVLKHKFLQLL